MIRRKDSLGYVDFLRGKYNQNNPEYAAMVQSLDESVGRVLDKLEETGLADKTFVIFTGDNGATGRKYCGYPFFPFGGD